MFRYVAMLSLMLVGAAMVGCQTSSETKYGQFGTELAMSPDETMEVSTVLADAKSYEGKTVRVGGELIDTCETSGCWATLRDEATGQWLVFKFEEHPPAGAKVIPVKAKGKYAIAEGKLKQGEVPEQFAKYTAELNGASEEEVAKIKGSQPAVWVVGTGCAIEGVTMADSEKELKQDCKGCPDSHEEEHIEPDDHEAPKS